MLSPIRSLGTCIHKDLDVGFQMHGEGIQKARNTWAKRWCRHLRGKTQHRKDPMRFRKNLETGLIMFYDTSHGWCKSNLWRNSTPYEHGHDRQLSSRRSSTTTYLSERWPHSIPPVMALRLYTDGGGHQGLRSSALFLGEEPTPSSKLWMRPQPFCLLDGKRDLIHQRTGEEICESRGD